MTRPPLSALLLGFAGLSPFVWGALVAAGYFSTDTNSNFPVFTSTDGRLILTRYGTIILCFMSGVLWGFATKAERRQATIGYVLSVIPALWIFLQPGRSADEALINLVIGFIGVLMLDFTFQRWQLAPDWWMGLRIPLTAVVTLCLCIGIWL